MTSALIVIDVQRALFETSPEPADAGATLSSISSFGVKIAAVPAADIVFGEAR